MIGKTLAIMTVVASITNAVDGSPHGHNDPYKPVIELLKEIRKQRKYGGVGGFREEGLLGSSSNTPNFQFPTGFNSNSGGGGGSGGSGSGSPPTPILTPSNSGGSGSGISSIIPPVGGSSSNSRPIFPTIPSGSQVVDQLGLRPPYPIEQVNNGVSTILKGVASLDLGQVLRGAFIFPRNENVRSVAFNVLDTIFGKPPASSGSN